MLDRWNICDRIAEGFCLGAGIEIGAFSQPVNTPGKTTYVDRVNDMSMFYPNRKEENKIIPDVIDNGESLTKFEDNSQDYVITRHVFEHFKNPLMALHNWDRVLKKNGIIYMTVPDKRYMFDSGHETTEYFHLKVDKAMRYESDMTSADQHEHFFDQCLLLEILRNFMQEYGYNLEFSYTKEVDITFILRKL